MTPAPADSAICDPLAGGSWPQCEQLIEAFERAWREGPRPNIDDYLSVASSERDALLIELVHVDLEFRLKAAESARVESYLSLYPQLTRDSAVALDLLESEYELRRRTEMELGFDEYGRRFPAYADDLRTRLERPSPPAGGTTVVERRISTIQPAAVPGYDTLKEIGRGGMGVIYQARQARLKRHVALKFLPADLVRDRALLDRFVREAITASALNHPNICTVHELGEYEGRPFIVMEFIDGQTLSALAARRPSVAESSRLIRQVARALAAAHAAGVVHRDIKPENIMVRDDGYVKVLDFGLARRVPTLSKHDTQGVNDTSPGALLGTIAYMSPEQARGEVLESASDVFSLGVVFYQLVTARHPFESDSAFSILNAIAACRPIPPARLNPEVSPALSGLIEAMLNKDARLRPSAATIEALLAAPAGAPRPVGKPDSASRPIVRRQQELAALRAAFAAAETGHSQLVCVAGEPGIGKTTVVEDFLDELASSFNCLLARGRCSERQAGTEAFLPVIEALADLLRSDATGSVARLMQVLAPTWHSQVTRAMPDDTADPLRATSQQAMLREFCGLLEEASRLHPVVLFFDDMHWADLSTVDLLAHLGRHPERLRLLMVATYRPTEMLLGPHAFHRVKLDLQAQGICTELPLGFLGRPEIDGYLDLAFPGHAFPSDFADLIHARTEGSPLFMADLLRYLRERGVITQSVGRWSLARALPEVSCDLPESVRSMIQRKLEQLSDVDRRLLGAAAVQGHEFDSAIVAAATGGDAAALEDRLQTLARVHGLVRLLRDDEFPDRTVTQRYAFVHVLYQQALAGEIPPTRKAALSLAFAQALERHHGPDSAVAAAQIACLFEAGRDFAQAAWHFHLAAQNAAQVFAHRDAIVLAQRGLRLLDALPASLARDELELPLQMTLGLHVQMTDGCAAESAKQAYDRARSLCRQATGGEAPFSVLWGLWLHYKVGSQLNRAQEVADDLLTLARKLNDPDLALQAHQALGLTALCRGDPAAALRHVEQVATLYDPHRHATHAILFGQDPAVICKAFGAIALWLLGFPDSAQRQSEAAIAMSRELSPTSQSIALHFAAMLHQLCGDAERTQLCAESSAAIAAEHGLSFWLAGGGVMIGWSLAGRGNSQEGISRLRRGLLDWQATESVTYRTYYLGLLAEALRRQGQIDEAQRVVDEALRLVGQTEERLYEAELHRLSGELLILDPAQPNAAADAQAEAAFRRAIAVSRGQAARSLELRAMMSLARLAEKTGAPLPAKQLLADTYGSFTEGFATPDLREARSLLVSHG
jgi:predicted ATPase/tRNA A-37 threonylcarbamoyl transferase component Bud32